MCRVPPVAGALIVAVNVTVSPRLSFSAFGLSSSDTVMPSTTLSPSVVILSVTVTSKTGSSPVFVTS
ncbi:hypothetical protein CXF45_03200 [Corynebacterium bovis]|nr:hypothetical protein CXF38_09985 [Corynebacterium bovis]RRO83351.1 hypothetical protein CXF36_03300 [Corynebacterium bovis]RRO84511.1 hypothetical protein CXF37_03055 [Corynebacterium bovis]RRO91675.1 hypothetical protein CXF45_03200 [Corynebacterium bovis]RRO95041.1 hypothetical protein CXF29_05805 [Corynebacterium bovis]